MDGIFDDLFDNHASAGAARVDYVALPEQSGPVLEVGDYRTCGSVAAETAYDVAEWTAQTLQKVADYRALAAHFRGDIPLLAVVEDVKEEEPALSGRAGDDNQEALNRYPRRTGTLGAVQVGGNPKAAELIAATLAYGLTEEQVLRATASAAIDILCVLRDHGFVVVAVGDARAQQEEEATGRRDTGTGPEGRLPAPDIEVIGAHRWTTEAIDDGAFDPATCTCGAWGGPRSQHFAHVEAKLIDARVKRAQTVTGHGEPEVTRLGLASAPSVRDQAATVLAAFDDPAEVQWSEEFADALDDAGLLRNETERRDHEAE